MFKIGEKVVCIDNKNGAEELVVKEMYTIDLIVHDDSGSIGFVLEGMDPYDAYYSWRFRKLDHGFSKDILEEITNKFRKEEPINA